MEKNNNSINQNIFEHLSQLLADEEFKLAQIEFFDKNCSNFENEEENKHIYHEIFKEYTYLIDKTIESGLSKHFSEEQINSFFEDFEINYKGYNNPVVVETLFSFTDFQEFKKLMLQYNKGESTFEKKEKIKENLMNGLQMSDEESFYKFDKYKNIPADKWKLGFKGKNEFEPVVYQHPFESTGLDLLKVEWVVKDISLQAIANKWFGPEAENKMRAIKFVKEIKIIGEKTENKKIQYMRMKMPMLAEREFLVKMMYRKIDSNNIQIIVHSVTHPEFPEKPSIIRGEMYKNIWISSIKGTNNVKKVLIDYQNLKGYIPKMFMNMIMSKMFSHVSKQLYADYKQEQDLLDSKK